MSTTMAASDIWRAWPASGAPRSAFPRSGSWTRRSARWRQLPTYHIFNGRSNEPMIELAEALLKIAPKGLVQGAVCEFRLGSQRPGGQDRLVLQQRDRPPAQEEDHQPRARLSRHHRVFRQHDGACAQPQGFRPAGGRRAPRGLSEPLSLRPAGRERASLRRSAGRQSRTDDHPRRPRHHRGVHRRAGERRGRRDRAAARLLSRSCRKCCAATTSCSSPTR